MHVTPVHQSGLLDIKSEKIDNKYYWQKHILGWSDGEPVAI